MLLIIILIVIGRQFNRLCEAYEKSKWYIALAIVTYFVGQVVAALLVVGYDIIFNSDVFLEYESSFNFLYLLASIISCLALYFFLKNKWKKEALLLKNNKDSEIERIGESVD